MALVLVPQSLAYAELAGMSAHTGPYAAALPPLAASILASSPYLQTGPTAMASLLALGAISTLATPMTTGYAELAALLALLVGLARVGVGVLRLGRLAYLLSQTVLTGFATAAAVLAVKGFLGDARRGDVKVEVADVPPQSARLVRKVLEEDN